MIFGRGNTHHTTVHFYNQTAFFATQRHLIELFEGLGFYVSERRNLLKSYVQVESMLVRPMTTHGDVGDKSLFFILIFHCQSEKVYYLCRRKPINTNDESYQEQTIHCALVLVDSHIDSKQQRQEGCWKGRNG